MGIPHRFIKVFTFFRNPIERIVRLRTHFCKFRSKRRRRFLHINYITAVAVLKIGAVRKRLFLRLPEHQFLSEFIPVPIIEYRAPEYRGNRFPGAVVYGQFRNRQMHAFPFIPHVVKFNCYTIVRIGTERILCTS